jgi:glycosyltransferase involved in cell wall biosynthesis
MRVLYVTPILETSEGGGPRAVAGMASALVSHGVKVTLATTVPATTPNVELVEADPRVEVRVFPRDRFFPLWCGYSRPLARFMASETRHYDLVHAHGLWDYPGYLAHREAHRLGIPMVVTPHGSLAPLALANDRLLKIVYTRVLQRQILRKASLIHALTRQEAEQVRAYGISTHTEVIPLGLDLDPDLMVGTPPACAQSGGSGSGSFIILFLGRVVPNKGLELLIETLAELKRRLHRPHLIVAGPYSEGYHNALSSLAERLHVTDSITFTGLVTGARKSETFASANVFVLPSYTEAFSIAVLEAMACGLPVVLTRQCGFPEAAEGRAALEVDPDVGQLSAAIEYLLERPGEAARMGQRGKALVERHYTWHTIIPRIIAAYKALVPGPAASGVAKGP